ncbi:MAG TPA: hypothetical protein V6C57_22800 [Coleofasciculaceae cyanobacterium]
MSAKYIGLWKRASIQLADADPYEDSIVFWLQAEKYFADIRIPMNQPCLPPQKSLLDLDPAELPKFAQFTAFAGTIDATESWIRWNRTIDFKPDPRRIDQGSVHFEDGNLIEIGEFEVEDEIQQYLEVWVPQSPDSSDRLVLELAQELNATTQTITHPKALWVMVGEHFIRLYDARFYPPDFVTPSDLSGADLQQLMHFQADYGQRHGEKPWQIVLSNDPSRIGTTLQSKANYHAQWLDDILIESWTDRSGETLEHHWHVRESTGDLASNGLAFLAPGP